MSVQVTLYGLSFLFHSSESNSPILIEKVFETAITPEEVLDEMKKFFNEQHLLPKKIETISVLFSSPYYTLVPSSLFDETKPSDYLKFNTKILAQDFVSYDEIENQDIILVYIPYVNINNYLFEKFGNFQYYHSVGVLLQYFLNKEKYSIETKVLLNVEKDWFDCIILSGGKVQLCNSYPYKSPEDFLYFTLFNFEQLSINPDTVKVLLCGRISENDLLFEFLYRYIRNVSFLEENLLPLNNEPSHKNFVLKALH
ncbi:MAG: DUF3822 family protein [Flavobacteriaceae bacterium]|nr:DUF3822 family protein [Flavobacteriaceae bacterium]